MSAFDLGSVVVSLTLAQDGALPPPGGALGPAPAQPAAQQPAGPVVPGATGPGTTTAPGAAPAPGGPGGPPQGGGGLGFFLPLMLVMIVFLVMTSMSGRKEKRRRAELLSGVKRGDKVQTVGGEIGTVVDLSETEMTLRVDEVSNTRIRFARSAVQQILKEGKEEAKA